MFFWRERGYDIDYLQYLFASLTKMPTTFVKAYSQIVRILETQREEGSHVLHVREGEWWKKGILKYAIYNELKYLYIYMAPGNSCSLRGKVKVKVIVR